MSFLSDIMIEVLKFFYAVGGHNYGLAIIWLTIAVNLALYPLTLSSIQQMSAMQKMQPKLQELQKKHKEEPKKLQQETMGLYKSEGVNPLGGCLPVLLKIPFFLALFWALQSKAFIALLAEPGGGSSFLWIANIAKPDPIKLLPILIGVSTFLMQRTMPSAGGQMQMMSWFMPIFIVFISFNFPTGVQLYWLISNAMGAVQQYYIMKKIPGKKAGKKGEEK
ncbi:MAG: YidC/Oxa1 family membrane protein insertase [Candidatus Margulisiibacteriota bacterium]|nr:YidC/Oxa1 family membrane protein insertase [Candidatus Margulisiibacteriota bacterium]